MGLWSIGGHRYCFIALEASRSGTLLDFGLGVPFSIAAIMGTAGPPRSYLFISLSILLSAAFSAVSVSRNPQLRGIVVAMLVAGYVWTGAEKLTATKAEEGLRAVGRYLKEQRRKGDIIVAPYIKT